MSTLHSSITREVHTLESRYPTDTIVVFDSGGFYRYVSANREQIMGFTREETYNRHYKDFVAPEYRSHVELTRADAILTGQSIEASVVLRMKSGEFARFRTLSWTATDPVTSEDFLIVKSRLIPDDTEQ